MLKMKLPKEAQPHKSLCDLRGLGQRLQQAEMQGVYTLAQLATTNFAKTDKRTKKKK